MILLLALLLIAMYVEGINGIILAPFILLFGGILIVTGLWIPLLIIILIKRRKNENL